MNCFSRLAQHHRSVATALLLAAASWAQAVVIDFNEFAFDPPPVDVINLGSSFNADGFDFAAEFAFVVPAPADFRVVSRAHPWQADLGFATIVMTDYPVRVTLTHGGGGPFDFLSIDLADSANFGVDRNVSFTFNFSGGGSVTELVVLDTLPGLQTFLFNKANLDSVVMRGTERFVGDFPWYQFDNVNATPVPEPGSWVLLGAGLIGLLTVRRPRHRRTAPAG